MKMAGKIYFEPKPDTPHPVRVSHGEFTWEAQGKPPYEATVEEWEKYLLPTGFFRAIEQRTRATSTKKE